MHLGNKQRFLFARIWSTQGLQLGKTWEKHRGMGYTLDPGSDEMQDRSRYYLPAKLLLIRRSERAERQDQTFCVIASTGCKRQAVAYWLPIGM